MTEQQAIEFPQSASRGETINTSEEPLQLEEMLTLIQSAHDLGYSVKDARDMKSLYDVISSDLYSVFLRLPFPALLCCHLPRSVAESFRKLNESVRYHPAGIPRDKLHRHFPVA